MYSAFPEVKLGNSEEIIFPEPKMLAYSDEELLFIVGGRRAGKGNKRVLGFWVWILEQ